MTQPKHHDCLIELPRVTGRFLRTFFSRNRVRLRRHIALRIDAKLRSRVDPSDVVQETHIVALSKLDDFLCATTDMPFHLWVAKGGT